MTGPRAQLDVYLDRVRNIRTLDAIFQFRANVPTLNASSEVKEALLSAIAQRDAEIRTNADLPTSLIDAFHVALKLHETINCKSKYAGRLRPMVKERGIVGAIEHLVLMKKPTTGFEGLVAAGHVDHTFEALVLRFPEYFSKEAQAVAATRLLALKRKT